MITTKRKVGEWGKDIEISYKLGFLVCTEKLYLVVEKLHFQGIVTSRYQAAASLSDGPLPV